MAVNWNKIIDGMTIFLVGVVLVTILTCTVILLAFDSLVGAGSMRVFTSGQDNLSIFISLATTGMTIALAFMAYLAVTKGYSGASVAFAIGAALVAMIDVYFDSLAADVWRYGSFVAIGTLSQADKLNHVLFRGLIGGLSLIGEPLAVAIIVGMPELKNFIRSVMPNVKDTPRPMQYATPRPVQHQTPRPIPQSIPRQQVQQRHPAHHQITFPEIEEEEY